jgi:hypothetical protein
MLIINKIKNKSHTVMSIDVEEAQCRGDTRGGKGLFREVGRVKKKLFKGR